MRLSSLYHTVGGRIRGVLCLALLALSLGRRVCQAQVTWGDDHVVHEAEITDIGDDIHPQDPMASVAEALIPQCSWQIKMAFNYTSQGLIDPEAVYFAQILPRINEKGVYKITGPFPPVRYFSFQIYSTLFSGDASHGMLDRDIKPHWGKNPFADPSATLETTGGYEIFITRSGKEGYPNEMQMSDNAINVLVLRMYKTDPVAKVALDQIPPPLYFEARREPNGKLTFWHEPYCSFEEMTRIDRIADAGYELAYKVLSGNYPGHQLDCPMHPARGNTSMVLFEGNWLSPAIRAVVARRGKDSPYLFYCLDPGHDMPGTMTNPGYVNGFIFTLKLKLPKFANGLYRKWKVSEPETYDLRYFSVSTADSVIPQPTIDGIDGEGIVKFYMDRPNHMDWDGMAHFTMATNKEMAKACGFDDPNSIFLGFSNDRIHTAKTPTVFVREVSPTGPRTAMPASFNCGDDAICGDAKWIKTQFEDGYYPELEVFHCDTRTGKITTF